MGNDSKPTSYQQAASAFYEPREHAGFEFSAAVDLREVLECHCMPQDIGLLLALLECPSDKVQAQCTQAEMTHIVPAPDREPWVWSLDLFRRDADIIVWLQDRRCELILRGLVRKVFTDALLLPDWSGFIRDLTDMRTFGRKSIRHQTSDQARRAEAEPPPVAPPVPAQPPGILDRLPEDQKRLARQILDRRKASIDGFASDFATVIAKDSFVAPLPDRELALAEIWEFADAQIEISKGIRLVERAVYTKTADSPEFDLLLARLSLALYFLECVAGWSRTAVSSKKPSLLSLVRNGAEAVRRILHPGYWASNNRQIINLYLNEEPILHACATACERPLLTLSEAIEQYKMEVAKRADALHDEGRLPPMRTIGPKAK